MGGLFPGSLTPAPDLPISFFSSSLPVISTWGISSRPDKAPWIIWQTVLYKNSPSLNRSSILEGWTLTSMYSGSTVKCSMVKGYLCCII